MSDPELYADAAPARPRGLSTRAILLIVFGALGGLTVVCCGGGAFVVRLGMREFASQVKAELADNAILVEKVGTVESFDMRLGDSMAASGDEVFVFDVLGSRARGIVTARCVTRADGSEQVVWAKLRLDSGEAVDLIVEAP